MYLVVFFFKYVNFIFLVFFKVLVRKVVFKLGLFFLRLIIIFGDGLNDFTGGGGRWVVRVAGGVIIGDRIIMAFVFIIVYN